jgi:RNA polymerase sigma-70 factor (ECF subfamily)
MNREDVVRGLIRDQIQLLGYLYAIVRETSLAEDLFQELVVLAMQKHEQIDDAAHLRVWARRAARLEGLKAIRKRGRTRTGLDEGVLDLLEPVWEESDPLDLSQDTEHLRSCMERLGPKAQEILKLKYVQSKDGAAIAHILKVKVHSVYVTLSRIHKTLGDCLEKKRLEVQHA